jgi:hypothetical protein
MGKSSKNSPPRPPAGHYVRYFIGALLVTSVVIVVGLFGIHELVAFFSELGGSNYYQRPSDLGALPAAENQFTVFYTAEDRRLHPQAFSLKQPLSDHDLARRVLAELTAGEPPEGYLESPLAPGCRARAVYLHGETVVVDFDPGFAQLLNGGTGDEALALYAVVNSLLTNLPDFAAVRFLIDGETCEALGGGLDLSQPLKINLALVENRE